MSTTSVGTMAAAAKPAKACATSITFTVGLTTMSTVAIRKKATDAWKKRFEPKRWPSLPPSMINPETNNEYITIAVPIVVGGVLKLSTIPPIEIGRLDALKDSNAWPMAITTIGNHEACVSAPALGVETDFVAIIVDDTNYRPVVAATT